MVYKVVLKKAKYNLPLDKGTMHAHLQFMKPVITVVLHA